MTTFNVQYSTQNRGVPNHGDRPQNNPDPLWTTGHTLYKVMEVALGVIFLGAAACSAGAFAATGNPLALIVAVGFGFAAAYFLESGLDDTPFRINNIFHFDYQPYHTPTRVQVGNGGQVQPTRHRTNPPPFVPRGVPFQEPNFNPPGIPFQQPNFASERMPEERTQVGTGRQEPLPTINIFSPLQSTVQQTQPFTVRREETRVQPGKKEQETPVFQQFIPRNTQHEETRVQPGKKEQEIPVFQQPTPRHTQHEEKRVKPGDKKQVKLVTPTAPQEERNDPEARVPIKKKK